MPIVTTDSNGPVDIDAIAKAEFVATNNPPVNQRALLDSLAVSRIAGLNLIRASVGDGDGTTGWVSVRKPGATVPGEDAYVQLSKVDAVSYIGDEAGEFAVLKRGGEVLGEVHRPEALGKVKHLFP